MAAEAKRPGVKRSFPAGVRVRPLTRGDIPHLRDGIASGSAAATTRWTFPESIPAVVGWFDKARTGKQRHQFAITHEKKLIGVCGLRQPIFSGREYFITIFEPAYQGKGIGTLATLEVCKFGFERLRLPRIELGVYPSNRRAIACYANCGFQYEGLLRKFLYQGGAWADVMLMSLLRKDYLRDKKPKRASRKAPPPGDRGAKRGIKV